MSCAASGVRTGRASGGPAVWPMLRVTLNSYPMPTYEYRCPKHHDFERFFRKISDAPSEVRCPECGEIAERRMSAGAAFSFKGSGFYLTDYGRNAHRGGAPEKGGEPASSSSSDSASGPPASGTSGESSPAAPSAASGSEKSATAPKSEAKPAAEAKPAKETKAPKESKPSPGKADS